MVILWWCARVTPVLAMVRCGEQEGSVARANLASPVSATKPSRVGGRTAPALALATHSWGLQAR
eukprot:6314197-Amphidinium_carterae.1